VLFVLKAPFFVSFFFREVSTIFRPFWCEMRGVDFRNGRFIATFIRPVFGLFSDHFLAFFFFLSLYNFTGQAWLNLRAFLERLVLL
jgi:hypothetical protein